jgi:cytochrome c-type biogenesis protein CcmE
MKKTHIVLLVGVALLIVSLLVFSADFSTYDSIESAKKKPDTYVHVIASLDTNAPIQFDPMKDPNLLVFAAKDSLGGDMKVIYKKGKPADLEKSSRLVLKGRWKTDHFECQDILLKCPSKYKDEQQNIQKDIEQQYPAGSTQS